MVQANSKSTTNYRKLHSTAGSSTGRLRRDNVTLTFDLSTPKPNQFIFVQR